MEVSCHPTPATYAWRYGVETMRRRVNQCVLLCPDAHLVRKVVCEPNIRGCLMWHKLIGANLEPVLVVRSWHCRLVDIRS